MVAGLDLHCPKEVKIWRFTEVETDVLNEVKEKVSQGCLTRTRLIVVVWCLTCLLIPLQEPQSLAKNALLMGSY